MAASICVRSVTKRISRVCMSSNARATAANSPRPSSGTRTSPRDVPMASAATIRRSSGAMMRRAMRVEPIAMMIPPASRALAGRMAEKARVRGADRVRGNPAAILQLHGDAHVGRDEHVRLLRADGLLAQPGRDRRRGDADEQGLDREDVDEAGRRHHDPARLRPQDGAQGRGEAGGDRVDAGGLGPGLAFGPQEADRGARLLRHVARALRPGLRGGPAYRVGRGVRKPACPGHAHHGLAEQADLQEGLGLDGHEREDHGGGDALPEAPRPHPASDRREHRFRSLRRGSRWG